MNLESYGFKSRNLVSYIWGTKGFGNECVLVTFDAGLPSIKEGLWLMYQIKYSKYKWIHKDIMILFYVNSSLSLSTKNFIDSYGGSERLNPGGWCGYISYAFNYQQLNPTYDQIMFFTNGINGNNADSDFLTLVTDNLKDIPADINLPVTLRDKSPVFQLLKSFGIQDFIFKIVEGTYPYYKYLEDKLGMREFKVRNKDSIGNYFHYVSIFITDLYNKMFD